MIKWLKEELKFIQSNDPAASSKLQIFLTMPSIHIIINYKINNFLYNHHLKTIALINSQLCKMFTGVEIHPGAKIGSKLFIDHGVGVVIGQTSVIGKECVIYHGVTLGSVIFTKDKRHPTVGDNVIIGAGAKLLGDIEIGNNVKIGANAVVTKSVPDNKVATGIPAVFR